MPFSSRAGSALLAVVLALGLASARAEEQGLNLQLRELTQTALDSDFKACKAINGKLQKAIADPNFDQLGVHARGLALYVSIACAPKDGDQGVVAARRLIVLPVEPAMLYRGQLTLLIDAHKRDAPAEYVAAIRGIAAADPSLMADWTPRDLGWILRKVKDDPALDASLLDTLHAVPWTDRAAREADANAWAVGRARHLLEAGDDARARAVLAGVTGTRQLAIVAQDRRFERLWPQLEADGRFDWVKLVQAELAVEQARIQAEPNLLEPVSEALGSLRALGRYDEALALGDAYAARLRKGDIFTDAKDQRAWMLNSLAYVYSNLGRVDEADRLMLESTGEDRVSQPINRAGLLNDAGRPAEAMKVLDAVDVKNSSEYGAMWLVSGKACARLQLGDKAAAETLIAGMRGRWKDNPAALTEALICLGAEDEAAALYIRRLDDPAERAGVLDDFRTTRPPPVQAPVYVQHDARRKAILARPEVMAALDKWGRPLTFPLSGSF